MTACTIFPESRRRPVYAAVALVLVMAAVLLAAGCVSGTQQGTFPEKITATTILPFATYIVVPSTPVIIATKPSSIELDGSEETVSETAPLFEIIGSTTILPQGTDSTRRVMANGYPAIKRIVPSIKKFDLVIFNHTAINEKLKSGQKIPVRIRGKDRVMNLTRMAFDTIDDGIDGYVGIIEGESGNSVHFTVSSTEILDSITLIDERIDIQPADNEDKVVNAKSQVHYIDSTKDTEDHGFVIDRGTATIPSVTATTTYMVSGTSK
jgi:hypothetical protein